MTDLDYVDSLRVAQTRIHLGDPRWYVQTANGFVLRGPHDKRDKAAADLKQIRDWAYQEAAEEEENDY